MYRFKNMMLIMAGTFLMAVATTSIYVPASLVTGGFSGIAIIISNVTKSTFGRSIPVWLTTLLLNLVLFGSAYKYRKKIDLSKCIIAATLFNVLLAIVPDFDIWNGDMFLATVYGGLINGAGVALVLLAEGTTGGTDLTAMLVQLKIKHKTIPEILLFIDGAVVFVGALWFGIDMAMYAVVAIYISSVVSDRVLEGPKAAKAVCIISEKNIEIAHMIMTKIERGVTGLEAVGMYSKKEGKVLMCVVLPKEVVRLKHMVENIDDKAFFFVYDVREVLGKGFFGEKCQKFSENKQNAKT